MWIFSRNGFVSLIQHPQKPGSLVVQTQTREEMEQVVRLLDGKHEIERSYDGSFRFSTIADKDAVAMLVAQLATKIDYSRFTQSVNFDFGTDPRFLLCMSATGLQVARISPE